MNRSSSRWIIGALVIVAAVALIYGLRHDQPKPQPLASENSPTVAAVPPPQPSTPPAPQSATPSRPQAATSSNPHDLTPNAAAQAPAVPNFVDLVQAVKPAVVSVRVKIRCDPASLIERWGHQPLRGNTLGALLPTIQPSWSGRVGPRPSASLRAGPRLGVLHQR